jgi:hypothetical protein
MPSVAFVYGAMAGFTGAVGLLLLIGWLQRRRGGRKQGESAE